MRIHSANIKWIIAAFLLTLLFVSVSGQQPGDPSKLLGDWAGEGRLFVAGVSRRIKLQQKRKRDKPMRKTPHSLSNWASCAGAWLYGLLNSLGLGFVGTRPPNQEGPFRFVEPTYLRQN